MSVELRTSRLFGIPVALIRLTVVAVAFNVNILLASPRTVDVQNPGIPMSGANCPSGLQPSSGSCSSFSGVGILNVGVATRLLERAPGG